MKVLIFRGILIAIVLLSFEIIGYLAMWFNSRADDIAANKNYFQIRYMLIGDSNPEHFPRYLTLPYLGYIQYPGYKSHGIVQNNEDGYRGKKVSLHKTNKLRILCMGGSTTYGFGVASPDQAYPARLESLLADYFLHDSMLGQRYSGVEVINAGLEAGNSAEELQQYLFKYRYYKPDIVIIHSGVNDALMTGSSPSDFQLDYTNYKRLNFNLPPLSSLGKTLLHSYFISFLSIRIFYDNFAYNGKTGKQCFDRQENQIFCKWTDLNIDSVISKKQYEYYPFYKNSKSVFLSVLQDSSLLVVFPNALNLKSEFVMSNEKYAYANSLNVNLSRSLCQDLGGLYVPFSYDSIKDPACWIDDCHLNAQGEENKAEILFRALIPQLDVLKR